MKLNEKQIEKLEAKGFKRWTKNGMDRLYINPTSYGVEYEYYNTGNIRTCWINGETTSNANGRRLKAAKVYIDIETGELHIKSDCLEDIIRENVQAIIDECMESEETSEESGIMCYIIGSEKDREEWLNDHILPFFRYEEQLDSDTVQLYNDGESHVVMYINLDGEPTYTVAAWDEESGCTNEVDYSDYSEACEACESEF